MKSLHILHSESASGWGGQEIRVFQESELLLERGYRVSIICQPESFLWNKCQTIASSDFNCYPLRMKNPANPLSLKDSINSDQNLKDISKNDERIIPIQCAISDKDGEELLNCYENGRFSSLLDFNKKGEFYNFCEKNVESFDNLKDRVKVNTFRLDTLIDKYNIDHIDYLKIDTQGTDLKVVQSLGKYLEKVDTIQMEVQLKELYQGSSPKEETIEYMNQNNFQLMKIMTIK